MRTFTAGKEILPPTNPTDPRWHALRKQGVGASEAAPLMGQGYKGTSALTVWESKVSEHAEVHDADTQLLFRRGHALEPIAASMWAEQNPWVAIEECGIVRSNTNPYAQATPDRVAVDDSFGLEIKTAGLFGFKRFSPDVVPPLYRWQALQCMLVTGIRTWHIFALHPDSFKTMEWTVTADDPDVAADMRLLDATIIDFWESYVLTGTPPEAEEQAELAYTPVTGGVDLSAEDERDTYLAILERRAELNEEIKLLTEEKKNIDASLKELAMTGPVHLAGQPLWELTVSQRTSIDAKKLQANHPSIYEFVSKTTEVRSINVKKQVSG